MTQLDPVHMLRIFGTKAELEFCFVGAEWILVTSLPIMK